MSASDHDDHGKKPRGILHPEGIRSIRHLASGVAHEVNNILGAIIGNAHIIKGKLDPDHAAQSFLVGIRDASEEGRELMHELGQLASERAVRTKPTDLNELVIRAVQVLPDESSCKQGLTPDLPEVDLDPTMAAGVLAGLLEFATQSTSEGTVLVETKDLETGDVELAVSDDGPNLSPEDLDAVFEPFMRLAHRPPIGLRLTRAADLAHRFGGTVTVEPREPQGLRIVLRFPRAT